MSKKIAALIIGGAILFALDLVVIYQTNGIETMIFLIEEGRGAVTAGMIIAHVLLATPLIAGLILHVRSRRKV